MAQGKSSRLSSGVAGLDQILEGGLIGRWAYLVRGTTGTGKTTLGLHFLMQGVAQGEKALFIALGDTEAEVRRQADSLGFDLSGVNFLDLSPPPEYFSRLQSYDIFSPAEEEKGPATQKIIDAVEALKPARVFVDAITQLRYLSTDPQQFRRQVFSFLRYLTDQGATVMLASEYSGAQPDDDLQFASDAVIDLERTSQGRQIEVIKSHASGFQEGRHSLRLTPHGIVVFPRLLPEAHGRPVERERLSFGVPDLDELLGGGITRGTVTIVSGPSGVGKTSLGLQFLKEAAGRGERSVVYTFEEEKDSIVQRSQGINIPIKAMLERGTLSIVEVEALRLDADEFAAQVRRDVEEGGATTVMIDSLSGYQLVLKGEDLVGHLHALCRYLARMGVTTFLVNEVETVTGDFRATEARVSYLADDIIFLRYLEVNGELRKAIGVLKKRLGDFEKTLREMEITRYGIKVGKPLTGLRGILGGTPEWVGEPARDERRAA